MAELSYETLSFMQKGENVQITLLNLFLAELPIQEFNSIGPFKILDPHTLEFTGTFQKKAEVKFAGLLHKAFENLTNKLTGNKAKYIHRNTGIPLYGNVAFGIINRGSSIIEIKPVTSCNLDCVYCSISEGLSSKKNDFVIEEAYLIEELEKLLDFIEKPVEIHIGVQGEPFLYADMELLIEDLQKMEQVHTISIDTNGTLLNEAKIDRLAKNDKLQMNMSLDAIDEDIARKVAGTKTYNVKHVKKMIAYASEKLNKVILAPVLTLGFNEEEMEKIILFIKSLEHKPILGIQNFLRYKTGRNPGKEMSWENFYTLLDKLEKKHDIKLKLQKEDFNIKPIKELKKPFVEGDEVSAMLKCEDRFPGSSIAVAKSRTISVPGMPFRWGKKVRLKITRDKHNIFVGKLVSR